ncbi:MAG: class I adenylate-forming enzyme family protein [Pseudohongiellaceae bacterium]
MVSREQVIQDLERLKTIVPAHKAAGMPLATETAVIDGITMEMFSKAPRNLDQVYQLGLATPDRDFLVYQQERFSFAESYALARSMAALLIHQYAIGQGDRVAICSRNNPEWCLAYMAITMIGAVVVPMNSWWTGSEMEYGLEDSGSKLLFADQERINRIQPHLEDLALEIIAIKPAAGCLFPEFHSLLETIPNRDFDPAAGNVAPEDNASIMYTSGSTGLPKGVLSTHRNIISALYTWQFVTEITEILRPELKETDPDFIPAILANVPLFHVTGSHAHFLASFVTQRKFVMMYKWNADKALELIEQEQISLLHGVPTMTWEVMHSERFAHTDLSSLRVVSAGGAARPPEHLALMRQKFPARALPGLGYGLTETNALGATISGRFYEFNPCSTGRPSPPVTSIKIADEQGNALPAREAGEICIKGASVMKAYWNKPDETRAVLRDGWFHTGDIGMLDELGFLTILDRAKDIVIRGGENIGCAEVEYAIAEHPAVSEVSVYGIPDDRLGEIPCAAIMLKPGASLSTDELKWFLKDRLAHFKIPESCQFQHQQLPRIASGKIAKKQLREQTIAALQKTPSGY